MTHFFFNMTRQFIVCLTLAFLPVGSGFAQRGTALLTMGDTAPS
ncbi:MAG: hypothetical protein JWQ74_3728, partial [Marmoricola sp.]|nr:hypothetical protein [Marmoricola sp.]